MKTFILSILALAATVVPASALTVTTPASGAQVTSPFSLVASSKTCESKPTVSMGYSIDNGQAIIEPTSFSATVSASVGAHVLRVKCWGQKVSAQTVVNITVVPPPPTTDITVTAPAGGAQVGSPFNLVASTKSCASVPAVSMGYSIDNGQAVIEPTSFSTMVPASPGAHVLRVKCWGQKTSAQVLLNITVVESAAATPVFAPAPGQYTTEQLVTLSTATQGATIYYTTDGSAPTTSSARYSGPISVGTSQVLEAVAVASGYTSSGLARADYIVTPPPSGPSIPPNAISATSIQNLNTWIYNHDAGTPGTAVGVTSLNNTPSLSGSAREFDSSYTDAGGEIYSVPYASDTTSMNFAYDAWVWIQAGSSIANLEMDSNQVIANGNTVIYAFQCDGYSHTWDYSGAGASWVRSTQPCNLSAWSTNTWHHIQITYSRDNSGNVTYQSVWLDGNEQVINATVPSSFALGWGAGVVQTQFQLDGLGASGSSTVYLDNLTISRW